MSSTSSSSSSGNIKHIGNGKLEKMAGASLIDKIYKRSSVSGSSSDEYFNSPKKGCYSSDESGKVKEHKKQKSTNVGPQILDYWYHVDLSLDCRACALRKTDIQIKERWSNKLLRGENWDVDDDADYIHLHDSVDVINMADETDPNIKWVKLRGKQSTFENFSRNMFIDCMKSYNVSEMDLNCCSIENIDSTMWNLMQNIERLSLASCSLDSIPEQVRSLKNLRVLNLRYNDLTTLPDWICELPQLEQLDIFGNKLSCLPDKLCDSFNLKTLIFSSNQIRSLTERLGDLVNLKCIEGANNQLTSLPDCFGSLKCLVKVVFSENKIRELPPSFAELPSLSYIDFADNNLIKLPESVEFTSTISSFVLDGNFISELPDWFACLPKLNDFSCTSNNLENKALSQDCFEGSKQLKELNFNGNKIDALPESISSLNTLTHLSVGGGYLETRQLGIRYGNKLQALPRLFGVLSSDLVQLRLDNNCISALPEHFGSGLQSLVSIDLSNNELTELPSSFSSMQNLQECVLSHNELETIPVNFCDLVSLTHLELDCNRINHLPLTFSDCIKLSTLNLTKNKFASFPSILAGLPNLDCLGFDIHVHTMPILMRHHLSGEAISRINRSVLNGLKYWNGPSSLRTGNTTVGPTTTLTQPDTSLRKFPIVTPGLFSDRASKHARSHFDFFEVESMVFDDQDPWTNQMRPLVQQCQNFFSVDDAEKVRTTLQKEIAFTERSHMPRVPNRGVAVPLFNRNPLKVKGVPLAYKDLAPQRRKRSSRVKKVK